MKTTLLALAIAGALNLAPAAAQPVPTPAPAAGTASATPQQPERTFTLTVTAGELGVIGMGLDQVPYRLAAPVITKLQAQIAEQEKPAPEKKP